MANSAITTNPYQAKSNNVQNSDGSSLATKVVTGMVVTDSPLMFRNRIINGDMRIDQRNSGAAVTTEAYCLDRWRTWMSTATVFSAQQNAGSITPPVGYSNYLGCTVTNVVTPTAAQRWSIQQAVEGFNVADLAWGTANAQSITVSFWARSSLTGTFGGVIRNSAGNRSYPFTYSVSAANTWEYKTVIIPGDTTGTWLTNNGIGLALVFSLGAGSSLLGAAGSWAGSDLWSATGSVNVISTNGATLYITGVQLEAGPTATPFERRPIGTELALCQRYYEKSYDLTVAPANNALVDSRQGIATIFNNTELMSCHIPFKVTKRTGTPVITTYKSSGPSGGVNGNWHYYAGAWIAFNVGSNVSQNYWMAIASSLSGVTNGQSFILSGGWSAESEL